MSAMKKLLAPTLSWMARDHAKAWLYTFFIADAVGLALSFYIAYTFRNSFGIELVGDKTQPFSFYVRLFPLLVGLFWMIAYGRGLYRHLRKITIFDELYLLGTSIGLWALFLMSALYLLHNNFSRAILLVGCGLSLIVIASLRVLLRKIRSLGFRIGAGVQNVLIVASATTTQEYTGALADYYPRHSITIHTFTIEPGMSSTIPVLQQALATHRPHIVFIENSIIPHHDLLTLISHADPRIEFRIAAAVFKLLSGSNVVSHVAATPTIAIRRTAPSKLYFFVKRCVDVFVSGITLVLLSPLLLALALIIKYTSPGAVLIKQRRIGFQGKPFTMYKFRTMTAAQTQYEQAPQKEGDARVTPVGRWLRKTSLDELPQFLNVFTGDMSLVGPRPEMDFIVQKYNQWQRHRLEAKPGLTGLWQIYGRKDIPLTENLEYDFYYINNQSLLLDFVILCKTIPVVLLQKGAY